MSDRRITDAEVIREKIARHTTWYHRIELAPGVVTPGTHNSPQALKDLDELGLPKNGKGLRVLDVGCRDGFFTFEMERRGAEVVAVDYATPESTGFPIASEILGSKAPYRVRNVYNLDPAEEGLYDVVLLLGVVYHLRNPMLALDRVRSVTKPGGLLFVESQVATQWTLWLTRTPVWQFYPRNSLKGDATNKWVPNLAGLKAAVAEAQFEVINSRPSRQRGYVVGRAVSDPYWEYIRTLDSSEGLFGKKA